MKKNEIKRTIEEVVRVEYIAEDGTVFYNEKECREYEESALFAVKKNLKKLHTYYVNRYDLFDFGSDDEEIEIFDIQSQQDLDNLKKYLYLMWTKYGFNKDAEKEVSERTASLTYGHEIIVMWWYEMDGFSVYGDGSLESYLDYYSDSVRNNYKQITTPKTEEVK